MKRIITILAVLISVSVSAQKKPQYRIVYCDTIGHILRVTHSNSYPKNNTTIYIKCERMKIINVVFTGYYTKKGKEIAIYCVPL